MGPTAQRNRLGRIALRPVARDHPRESGQALSWNENRRDRPGPPDARRGSRRKPPWATRACSNGLNARAHIGTGNYHARTARLYADFGLFTCDPNITQDVVALFHHL